MLTKVLPLRNTAIENRYYHLGTPPKAGKCPHFDKRLTSLSVAIKKIKIWGLGGSTEKSTEVCLKPLHKSFVWCFWSVHQRKILEKSGSMAVWIPRRSLASEQNLIHSPLSSPFQKVFMGLWHDWRPPGGAICWVHHHDKFHLGVADQFITFSEQWCSSILYTHGHR